jgi:enoyl-CoA hydratase/carnithine racemase
VTDYETLLIENRDNGVVVATINRPDRANSMTSGMFDDLHSLALAISDDPTIRVLILTGAGAVFCPGYDIDAAGALPTMTPREFLALQEKAARALSSIRSVRVPVIAAVNGAAAGGGLSLALAADIRIAAPSAKFNAAFVKIGLSAGDLGVSWLLPRLIGPGRAAEITLTGRQVFAEEAERIGLVTSISAEGAVLDDALALAAQIVGNSPGGVELSKRALQANLEVGSYAAAMELENRGQTLLTQTEDMAEALAAFREKRSPDFTGR